MIKIILDGRPYHLHDDRRGVMIRTMKSRLQIKAPYTEEWRAKAKQLNGQWKRRGGFWSISAYHYNEVADVLNKLYGTEFPNYYPKDGQSAAANDREEASE